MMKTFKKAIAVMLTFVFVASILPLGVLADDVTIRYSSTNPVMIAGTMYGYGTSSDVDQYSNVMLSSTPTARTSSGSNNRIAFFQYDISDYMRYLTSDTAIDFGIYHGKSGGGYVQSGYKLYIVKGEHVDETGGTPQSKMSMKYAYTELGIVTKSGSASSVKYSINTSSENLIEVGSYTLPEGKTKVSGAHIFENISADAVKSAVGDNGWITFIIDGGTSLSWFTRESDSTYLYINYDANSVSDQDYLDEIVDNVQWSDLSDDEITSVVNQLATEYRGTNIEWSSEPAEVINSDGTINFKFVEQEAVLTANFSYTGANGQIVTASKKFDVTIAKKPQKTEKIYFKNAANTRDNSEGTFISLYQGNSSYLNAVQVRHGGASNMLYGYFQADLSGFEEILQRPSTKITFDLECGGGSANYPSIDYQLVLFPDIMDDYDHKSINHAYAYKHGMQNASNGVVLHTNSDGSTPSKEPISLELDPQIYINALNTGIDGILTFGILPLPSTTKTGYFFPLRDASGITISYYDEEVDDESYFADLEKGFAWEKITSDGQEALVNKLPKYYKGANIVWSSGEGVITSSGELIPSDGQLVNDTLTATVSYKGYSFTKTFDVTVCDGKVTLGAPGLTVADGKATASVVVTNGTDKTAKYNLYLAVYTDTEMTELVPFELIVEKGREDAKELTVSVPDGSSVKFFAWESDNKTPAFAAIEK